MCDNRSKVRVIIKLFDVFLNNITYVLIVWVISNHERCTKINFQGHLDNIMSENDKTIGLMRKLQAVLLRSSLVTIYKSFIRPHLDYGDDIYS